ncbi:MAG: cyclic nucleotide-binding domain-containing protein [Bdellovibrionales bacterium]|nr:cyclic nucleotide-binding domain-containing protein [Bdellovibrionales bacterium]
MAESNVRSLIKNLDFFKHFPDHLLDEISKISSLKKFEMGSEILKQGQSNQNLYFLLKGSVSVVVDEGIVANLNKTGDLLGEMSVISNKPCAATILANNEVEVLELEVEKVNNIPNVNIDQIQHSLFRIYSNILTEKLRLTNQKAKHFEDLSTDLENAKQNLVLMNKNLEKKVEERTQDLKEKNLQLLESFQVLENKNTELNASYIKLEELIRSRDLTFQMLDELYQSHLIPLQKEMKQYKESAASADKELIDSMDKEVIGLINHMAFISTQFSSERKLKDRKVLVVDTIRKQQIIAKMALGGTGVSLDVASNSDEAHKLLVNEKYDVIFVDSENLSLAELIHQSSPNTQCVYVTSEPIDKYLGNLKKIQTKPHIISRDDDDRAFTVKNFMTSITKLINKNIFGLDKYFAWGTTFNELKVTNSSHRQQLIESMISYFQELGVRKSNLSRVQTVCEEMLMNAIYDAPVDKKTGKSKYNHLSRLETVELNPDEQSVLRFASDGLLMGVSVEDPFGGLTIDTLLTYLESCYVGEAGKLNQEKGGAGRGLHQIIENSDLVIFNVLPKKRTEVIALFHADLKTVNQQYPSFHFFTGS